MRSLPRLSLQATILLIQLGIVLGVVGLVSAAFIGILSSVLEHQYGERVLGIAQTVSRIPEIREAFDDPDPPRVIQPLAQSIQESAGLSFVVVSNRDRIRYSHPVPERIGQPLSTDDTPALDGTAYVVTEVGTLGRSIRAKAPIFRDGQVIGAVSVGILEEQIQTVLQFYWPQIALVALGALAAGAAVSGMLSSHIKRQIFDLEPRQIAALFEYREAMLSGIREGVLAIDQSGTITLVNDEAKRLLNLPDDAVGQPVTNLLPESELPAVLETGRPQQDQITLAHNGRAIVVNRMPVRVRGKLVGAISTFRDQTEVQQLARELTGTRTHLDVLRAQAHEFANKLHTISGLIELGWNDRAVSLIKATTQAQQTLIDDLPQRIADPAVAALLVGKASVAGERGVILDVSPSSRLRHRPAASDDLVTIVGNLLENAFDATAGQAERFVHVEIEDDGAAIWICVRDTGPGISESNAARIFEQGFTTKSNESTDRGVGLSLVRRAVDRWEGTIEFMNDGGAVFEVWLPQPEPAVTGSNPLLPLAG